MMQYFTKFQNIRKYLNPAGVCPLGHSILQQNDALVTIDSLYCRKMTFEATVCQVVDTDRAEGKEVSFC